MNQRQLFAQLKEQCKGDARKMKAFNELVKTFSADDKYVVVGCHDDSNGKLKISKVLPGSYDSKKDAEDYANGSEVNDLLSKGPYSYVKIMTSKEAKESRYK